MRTQQQKHKTNKDPDPSTQDSTPTNNSQSNLHSDPSIENDDSQRRQQVKKKRNAGAKKASEIVQKKMKNNQDKAWKPSARLQKEVNVIIREQKSQSSSSQQGGNDRHGSVPKGLYKDVPDDYGLKDETRKITIQINKKRIERTSKPEEVESLRKNIRPYKVEQPHSSRPDPDSKEHKKRLEELPFVANVTSCTDTIFGPPQKRDTKGAYSPDLRKGIFSIIFSNYESTYQGKDSDGFDLSYDETLFRDIHETMLHDPSITTYVLFES